MSTRAPSARLLAKRAANSTDLAKQDSSTATRTSPRKKQKVQVTTPKKKEVISEPREPRLDDFKKIKGKRGQLKTMTELPLDILIEIFGHLEPYDLLRLSEASKALRAIIVGENTSSLWKKAYANVQQLRPDLHSPPPPCPPQESILWYTDFLFGSGCQFCSAAKASILHWTARARLCNKCAKIELVAIQIDSNAPTIEAQQLCASWYVSRTGVLPFMKYILKREHDWHVRQLQKYVDSAARNRYINNRRQYLEENDKFTDNLQQWETRRRTEISIRLGQVRTARVQAITDKLTEAGYSRELVSGRHYVSRLPGVSLTVPLTEKDWEKIKTNIIRVFEWQRQETRKSTMIRSFQMRLPHLSFLIGKAQEGLPKPWIYPPTSEVARLEPFASVMKADAENNELTALLSIKRNMDNLRHCIPNLVKIWRDDADKFLLGLLQGGKDTAMSVDGAEVDRRPLELATTFFKCRCSCKEPISYPRILMHSCLRSHRIRDKDDDDVPQEIEDRADDGKDEEAEQEGKGQGTSAKGASARTNPGEVYGIPTKTVDGVWNKMSSWWGARWNEANVVGLDDEAVGFARAIVQACGEDPNAATAAAINARDFRVECTRCVPPPDRKTTKRFRHITTWKAAILHDISYHFEQPPMETGWKLLTDEDELNKVRELENTMRPTVSEQRMTRCDHCNERPPSFQVISSYAANDTNDKRKFKKGSKQIEIKRHICTGVDAPMKAYPYPVKI